MPQKRLEAWSLLIFEWEINYYLFTKNYITSEGAISHNVFSMAHYQVCFDAINNFE